MKPSDVNVLTFNLLCFKREDYQMYGSNEVQSSELPYLSHVLPKRKKKQNLKSPRWRKCKHYSKENVQFDTFQSLWCCFSSNIQNKGLIYTNTGKIYKNDHLAPTVWLVMVGGLQGTFALLHQMHSPKNKNISLNNISSCKTFLWSSKAHETYAKKCTILLYRFAICLVKIALSG